MGHIHAAAMAEYAKDAAMSAQARNKKGIEQ